MYILVTFVTIDGKKSRFWNKIVQILNQPSFIFLLTEHEIIERKLMLKLYNVI